MAEPAATSSPAGERPPRRRTNLKVNGWIVCRGATPVATGATEREAIDELPPPTTRSDSTARCPPGARPSFAPSNASSQAAEQPLLGKLGGLKGGPARAAQPDPRAPARDLEEGRASSLGEAAAPSGAGPRRGVVVVTARRPCRPSATMPDHSPAPSAGGGRRAAPSTDIPSVSGTQPHVVHHVAPMAGPGQPAPGAVEDGCADSARCRRDGPGTHVMDNRPRRPCAALGRTSTTGHRRSPAAAVTLAVGGWSPLAADGGG